MSNSGTKSRKSAKSVSFQGGENNPGTSEGVQDDDQLSTSWFSSLISYVWPWYKSQPQTPSNAPTPVQPSEVEPLVSTISPPQTEILQPSVSPSIYPYPPLQSDATQPEVSPSVYPYPPFQTEIQQPSVSPSAHAPFPTEVVQPSVSPAVGPPTQTEVTPPSATRSSVHPPAQTEGEQQQPNKPFWSFLWPWVYNQPASNDPAVQQKPSRLSRKSKSSTIKSSRDIAKTPIPKEKLDVKQQPRKDLKSGTSKTSPIPPVPPPPPNKLGVQQQSSRDTKSSVITPPGKSTKTVEGGTGGAPITRKVSSQAATDEPVKKTLFRRAASFVKKVPDILLSYTPWGSEPTSNEDETPGPRKSVASTTKKSRTKSLSTKSKSAPTLTSRFSRSSSSKGTRSRLPSQAYLAPVVEDQPLSYIPGIDVLVTSAAATDETKFRDSSTTESEAPTPPKPQTPVKVDELNKNPVDLPRELTEDLKLKKSPESNWQLAFQELVVQAAQDERYEPRNIAVFKHTDDHGDTIDSDSDIDDNTLSKMVALTESRRLSTAFQYNLRPFRMPHLAVRQADLDSGPDNLSNIYKFKPIKVDFRDWAMIRPGNEMRLAANKWTLSEPIRADRRLLPEIDPLVKYKLKRLGKNQVTPQELAQTQQELVVGITPSGRKLDGNSSGSGEECVYKRVLCKNDPEFDILHPYVETESGEKWPNPFLFYWNWKKTDENPNEAYLHNQRPGKDHELVQKRRVAIELESHPLKIPYVNLGVDDTDYEDPLGPLSITQSIKPTKSNKKNRKSNISLTGGEVELEDPMTRRYPYMLLDQYTIYYRAYYHCRVLWQEQRRLFHKLYLQIRGKHTSTCITLSSYPCWFYFWKNMVRHWVRRVPRRFKFCSERNVETVFYGTLASLFATQYIGEHDLLPNMDDPVNMSQLALEKALEIKEKFLVTPKSGRPYVDYIKLQRSKSYERYMEWIGLLCRYQPSKMPPRVRKAFFLNYFNVLSIQTQIVRIPEKEYTKYLCEMKDFWGMTKGLVGFMELSLEEIYHGILRCNRLHPTKQVRVFQDHPVKGFPKEMSPSRLSLDWMDPRIHFALSVGCKSCPPIHSISLYEQDCQLDEVARTYVRSRVKVDLEHRTVTLPILFLWYEKDFGNNKFIMLWYLKQFMLSNDMLKIRQLLTSKKSITLRYERFNEEIDHVVQRHPATKCDPVNRRKNITVYWGSKF